MMRCRNLRVCFCPYNRTDAGACLAGSVPVLPPQISLLGYLSAPPALWLFNEAVTACSFLSPGPCCYTLPTTSSSPFLLISLPLTPAFSKTVLLVPLVQDFPLSRPCFHYSFLSCLFLTPCSLIFNLVVLFRQSRFFSPFSTPSLSSNSSCLNPHTSSSIVRLLALHASFSQGTRCPPCVPLLLLRPVWGQSSQQGLGACPGGSARAAVADGWLSPTALQQAHTLVPPLKRQWSDL